MPTGAATASRAPRPCPRPGAMTEQASRSATHRPEYGVCGPLCPCPRPWPWLGRVRCEYAKPACHVKSLCRPRRGAVSGGLRAWPLCRLPVGHTHGRRCGLRCRSCSETCLVRPVLAVAFAASSDGPQTSPHRRQPAAPSAQSPTRLLPRTPLGPGPRSTPAVRPASAWPDSGCWFRPAPRRVLRGWRAPHRPLGPAHRSLCLPARGVRLLPGAVPARAGPQADGGVSKCGRDLCSWPHAEAVGTR